jgi:hypothetical protein
VNIFARGRHGFSIYLYPVKYATNIRENNSEHFKPQPVIIKQIADGLGIILPTKRRNTPNTFAPY